MDHADEERCIGVFNSRSEAHGWPSWTTADVRPQAPVRLYRATASAVFALGPDDERIAVSLA